MQIISNLVCLTVGFFVGANYNTEVYGFMKKLKDNDSLVSVNNKEIKILGYRIVKMDDVPPKK
jgi:hypothetical protein